MWEEARQDGAARGAGTRMKRLAVLEGAYNVMCSKALCTHRGEMGCNSKTQSPRSARPFAREGCCSSSRKQRLRALLRKAPAARQVVTSPGPFHQAPYGCPQSAWIVVLMPWQQLQQHQQPAIGAAVGGRGVCAGGRASLAAFRRCRSFQLATTIKRPTRPETFHNSILNIISPTLDLSF